MKKAFLKDRNLGVDLSNDSNEELFTYLVCFWVDKFGKESKNGFKL